MDFVNGHEKNKKTTNNKLIMILQHIKFDGSMVEFDGHWKNLNIK